MAPKWWVLAAVACGTFMATLDASIVNIALPTLTIDLGPDLYRVKWVIIVYLLVITCLLLPFGRLSDQQGRKPVFQTGFIIFILGSALCGLAPHLSWLILFRGVQAVGAAMLMANGPAIIASSFSPQERGTALGTLAMVVSLGLVTGPGIGGFLISNIGWRSIFWVNLPIGLLGIGLVQRYLKADTPIRALLPFDWGGAFLQSIILIMFMILFDPPRISFSGMMPLPISRWMIGIVLIFLTVVLFKIEAEVRAPLIDISLLENRAFWTANLSGFLVFVAFSSVTVLMPFVLEEVFLFAPHEAGLYMTAVPLTIFIVAPISGRLSDHLGSLGLCVAGTAVGGIALFAMAGLFGNGIQRNTDPKWIILGLCSIGLATGLFQAPNNSAIMSSVPVQKLSVASALLATIRNLGLVTGTGLSTGIFTWCITKTHDYVAAFHAALFVAGIICIGALIASFGKLKKLNRKIART